MRLVKILLKEKNRKIIIWLIFAVYIIVLLRLTVFRSSFLDYSLFTHGELNFVPFALYLKLFERHMYLYAIYQFGGNIVWFIPFGFLLPYLTGSPKALKRMLLFGFLLSFFIEFSQFAFGTGESELDDLILNTFGAFVGFRLFRFYTRFNDARVKEKKT